MDIHTEYIVDLSMHVPLSLLDVAWPCSARDLACGGTCRCYFLVEHGNGVNINRICGGKEKERKKEKRKKQKKQKKGETYSSGSIFPLFNPFASFRWYSLCWWWNFFVSSTCFLISSCNKSWSTLENSSALASSSNTFHPSTSSFLAFRNAFDFSWYRVLCSCLAWSLYALSNFTASTSRISDLFWSNFFWFFVNLV